LRYISALPDAQVRRLLWEGVLQVGLFSEEVGEVEADGVRYLLRKNQAEAAREQHRSADKLAKSAKKVQQRNQQVQSSARCRPEAGLRRLQPWVARDKLTGLVGLRLEGREMVLENNQAARERAVELATDPDPRTTTAPGALAALSRLCLQNYEIDEKTLVTRLPRPDADQEQILGVLGVSWRPEGAAPRAGGSGKRELRGGLPGSRRLGEVREHRGGSRPVQVPRLPGGFQRALGAAGVGRELHGHRGIHVHLTSL
jgi:hypothetical protein